MIRNENSCPKRHDTDRCERCFEWLSRRKFSPSLTPFWITHKKAKEERKSALERERQQSIQSLNNLTVLAKEEVSFSAIWFIWFEVRFGWWIFIRWRWWNYAKNSSREDERVAENGVRRTRGKRSGICFPYSSFVSCLAQMPAQLVKRLVKYGKVIDLSKEEFVDSIDNTPSDVNVVIHLFEDVWHRDPRRPVWRLLQYIPPCKRINHAFESLAKKYPKTKFCRIRSKGVFFFIPHNWCSPLVAQAGFDEIGLPVIIVYRGGELLKSFVKVHYRSLLSLLSDRSLILKVTDDLPEHFDYDDIHALFLEYGPVSVFLSA